MPELKVDLFFNFILNATESSAAFRRRNVPSLGHVGL